MEGGAGTGKAGGDAEKGGRRRVQGSGGARRAMSRAALQFRVQEREKAEGRKQKAAAVKSEGGGRMAETGRQQRIQYPIANTQ